ncbi:MAG: glycosyltransferase family 8 protein [archaeon]
MKNDTINIACSTNDNYAPHMGVMLYSLLKNCSSPDRVRIYVADGGISTENKDKLKKVVDLFKAELNYLLPNTSYFKNLAIGRHFGIETYYRFFLMDHVKVKKMLYLDCDLIFEGDVSALYAYNLGKNIVAAVKDFGDSSKRNLILGLGKEDPYFNAGVLLVDCERFRKEKITKKVIEFIKHNLEKVEFADQDGLNAILTGKWREIDMSWNVMPKLAYHKYFFWENISSEENRKISELLRKPKIIHYSSYIKPWYLVDMMPLKGRYHFYLKDTPWRDQPYKDASIIGIIKRLSSYFLFFYYKRRSLKSLKS